ncbi:MAG TPA: DoxX family protein [Gammaproteobacteria bacterium]|nr:DoxX family protein [Gammaproteobacteria bacterium]
MRIASVGHALFAATMIGLGILGLVKGDFTPFWRPVPKGVPAREVLVYLCALISLASGAGLLWQRIAASAARVLFGWLVLWLLVFRVPVIFPAPGVLGSWYGCVETVVIIAAVWVLYIWFATDWDRRWLGFATGDKGVHTARVLYGMSLIFFGTSHFVYLNLTVPLIPGWLPAHVFWAYFFGCTYIAAGAAILAGVYARLAAALTTLQMGMFLLLVWVPRVAAGHISAFQWGETVVTCALIAGAWVITDSYRGVSWFAVNKR